MEKIKRYASDRTGGLGEDMVEDSNGDKLYFFDYKAQMRELLEKLIGEQFNHHGLSDDPYDGEVSTQTIVNIFAELGIGKEGK